MEYRVCAAVGTDKLQKEVNELLQQGWELQGGISFNEGAFHYLQAMVRHS
ncbi:MAG TPA: DUF1737 domain-containing protein [Myxococcales bacterium]|nr:DUF1737 domain-containing protein [Myxococcales bacterium]